MSRVGNFIVVVFGYRDMVRHQDDDTSRKERLTDRRSVLKAVGGTATALGVSSFIGSAAAQVNADTVVDLGQEGLSDGDNIDSYLEEHFQSGTEIHVPAGEYNYSGAGLGGSYSNAALIGAPEGVAFNRPDDPEEEVRPTLWAESGTVRLENITVRGKRGEAQSRWRVGAAEGARFEVVNVNLPDGTVDGSDSTGVYSGTDHAGTLWVKSCFFSNFGNVALYVSDPYWGGDGKVIVEDCDFVNTGMSALRFAPTGSECRRCYFEATERAPAHPTGWNQRGIKIDDPGEDVVIEDCDFNWSDIGAMAVDFDDEGEGGTGTIQNIRVSNDGGTTFVDEWGVEGDWSGESVHLTGEADHNAPSHFETITGSDAQEPDTSYEIWTPVDANVTDDSTTDGAGGGSTDSSSDGSSGDDTSSGSADRTVLLEASQDNPDTNMDVSFTTSGPIEFAGEAESGTDTITQNDDGTYTATSLKMDPGALDSYSFGGDVLGYSITDGYELARVEVDGQQTTFEELVATSSDGGSSGTPEDSSPRVLVVDGTGDAEEVGRYEIAVTGTIERDEERSVVAENNTPWDLMSDYVGDSRVAGVVGNGKDAYRITGEVTARNVEGEAEITVLSGK